jgi:hypothetical protein
MSLPNEKTVKTFKHEALQEYDRFFSDWESSDLDDHKEIADYMYKCAQNRTLADAERDEGMNTEGTARANTGSTLFWRSVNQLGGELSNMVLGAENPFTYNPIVNTDVDDSANTDVDDSAREGIRESAQRQALAKWIMKKDDFIVKWTEFSTMLGKLSNIPWRIIWKEDKRRVMTVDENGKKSWEMQTVAAWPSFEVLNVGTTFADFYTGRTQRTIIVVTKRAKHEIAGDVRAKKFDRDQWKKILEAESTNSPSAKDGKKQGTTYHYDGATLAEFFQKKSDNMQRSHEPSEQKNMFLQWDVYMYAPISGEKDKEVWDDMQDEHVWLGTFIGNSLSETDSVAMRLDKDTDPDGEIPVYWTNANPDDTDLLYHVMDAEILRANYSTQCSLIEFGLDNVNENVNAPAVAIKGVIEKPDNDLSSRPGNIVWLDLDALEGRSVDQAFNWRTTPDMTGQVRSWLEYFNEDSRTAMNQSVNDQNQHFGGRTAATEVANIARSGSAPNVARQRYIQAQTLPKYARKIQSYMQAFSKQDVITAVQDDGTVIPVKLSGLKMDYDVVVDLADESGSSLLDSQKMDGMMQTIAGTPGLMASPTHRIDMGIVSRKWFELKKIKGLSRAVEGRRGEDPKQVARFEQAEMRGVFSDTGQGSFIPPQPGQDHSGHLAEHESERMRYQGLENTIGEDGGISEQDAQYLQLLDLHIAFTKQMAQQEQQQAPPPAAPTGNVTEGQAQGNQLAEALGGAQ